MASKKLEQIDSHFKQLSISKPKSELSSGEITANCIQEITEPTTAIVQQQITGNEVKVLIISENGEQRLITFEIPKEECTVQDLLDQVTNLPSVKESYISLVEDAALGINYIVDCITYNDNREQKEMDD